MKHDCSLSAGLGAPDNLDDLHAFMIALNENMRSSELSYRESERLIMDGSKGPCRPQDLWAAHGYPTALPHPRTSSDIKDQLDRLIMPSAQADARAAFQEQLGIDDPHRTADLLYKLDQTDPEKVTALLELRFLRADQIPRSDPTGKMPVKWEDLLKEMFRIRVAFWLRTVGMECAAKLHRPSGRDELDRVDGPGSPRIGAVIDRLKREVDRTESVIELFESGKEPPAILTTVGMVHWLEANLRSSSWAADGKTCTPESGEQWLGIVAGALERQEILRDAHGANLIYILRREIKPIKMLLRQFKRKLEKRKKKYEYNTRLGNSNGLDPMVLLYHCCRFAGAWTLSNAGPSHIDSFFESFCESHQDISILPALHKDHATEVLDLFSILRFAFMNDDNMLPADLRKLKLNGKGKPMLKSQANAMHHLGKEFSFSELWQAYNSGTSKDSAIVRKARPRVTKTLEHFPSPMKGVVTLALAWLHKTFYDG